MEAERIGGSYAQDAPAGIYHGWTSQEEKMVKNTLKLAGALWLLFLIPTGTPEDFIIIPFLIKTFGHTGYILIVSVAAYLLYKSTEGKTLGDKLRTIRKEVKSLLS